MRSIQFSPSAIDDLKLFKPGNQKLVFKPEHSLETAIGLFRRDHADHDLQPPGVD